MSYNKPIHRIAIVGTGVIGASWAAQYLARGFDVVATDPAPNAEANLRKYVDEAWEQLTAIGLSPGASRDRLTFTTNMVEALSKADFVQENGPERPDFKIKLFAEMDEATPPELNHCIEFIGNHAERHAIRLQAPRACPGRSSIQSSAHYSIGGSRRRQQNIAEAIQQAIAFYASIGKKPILLHKELPGHVGEPNPGGSLSRGRLSH